MEQQALMTQKAKQLVEEVYGGDFNFPEHFRFSDFVWQRLQKDYVSLSDAFIATEKKTIEQYIIEFRINKVKEYLVYTNLRLADIAFRLHFSSVADLFTQLQQQTGLTPPHFKNIRKQKLKTFFSQN